MRNVAIFGGTFNPIHWGHLLVAETALNQFGLEQVIWVPTCYPPHKNQSLLAFNHRLEMVRRAIADHPAFIVSDVDAQRQGVSYAIVTLTDLQALHPNSNWFWITGIDAFQTLPKWRESEALATQCVWLVAPRREGDLGDGEAEADAETRRRGDAENSNSIQNSKFKIQNSPHASLQICQQVAATMTPSLRWHLLEMPKIEISSSFIRQACWEGRSIRYLVPEAIRLYILEFKLYAK